MTGSLGAPGAAGQDPRVAAGATGEADPRWFVAYEHDRRAPFLDLAVPPPDNLPRALRAGIEHWRHYLVCPDHRRRRRSGCHHHQHHELKARHRGQGRGKRGQLANVVELAHKRSESAEHHSRFAQWALQHMDQASAYVGKVGAAGTVPPYTLEEIAEELRRPGEERLPLPILCEVLNAFDAGGNIHRHQGRRRFCVEHKIENCSACEEAHAVIYWKGKIASLRLTKLFLIRSRVWTLLEQARKASARKAKKKERAQAMAGEFGAVAAEIANQLSDSPAEKFRRDVMGEHPDWVLQGRTFAIDAEVDRRVQEWQRRRDEARLRGQRPPDQR